MSDSWGFNEVDFSNNFGDCMSGIGVDFLNSTFSMRDALSALPSRDEDKFGASDTDEEEPRIGQLDKSASSINASKVCIKLKAPTSPATRHNEDSLTYLNQGQSYEIVMRCGTSTAVTIKSVVRIRFHEHQMQYVEDRHFQSWKHAHPGQSLLEVDTTMSYGYEKLQLEHRPLDEVVCIWNSRQCGIILRFRCVSTEFTAKKHGGEKGVPFRIQIDNYNIEDGQHLCSSACQVKIFKPKGADRKHKTDREKIERKSTAGRAGYKPSAPFTEFLEVPPPETTDYHQSSGSKAGDTTDNLAASDMVSPSSVVMISDEAECSFSHQHEPARRTSSTSCHFDMSGLSAPLENTCNEGSTCFQPTDELLSSFPTTNDFTAEPKRPKQRGSTCSSPVLIKTVAEKVECRNTASRSSLTEYCSYKAAHKSRVAASSAIGLPGSQLRQPSLRHSSLLRAQFSSLGTAQANTMPNLVASVSGIGVGSGGCTSIGLRSIQRRRRQFCSGTCVACGRSCRNAAARWNRRRTDNATVCRLQVPPSAPMDLAISAQSTESDHKVTNDVNESIVQPTVEQKDRTQPVADGSSSGDSSVDEVAVAAAVEPTLQSEQPHEVARSSSPLQAVTLTPSRDVGYYSDRFKQTTEESGQDLKQSSSEAPFDTENTPSTSGSSSSFHGIASCQFVPNKTVETDTQTVKNVSSSLPPVLAYMNTEEVSSWLSQSGFSALKDHFKYFNGMDMLRLTREDFKELCGVAEGTRLYNAFYNKPPQPRRILYFCKDEALIYRAILLYELNLRELRQLVANMYSIQSEQISLLCVLMTNGVPVLLTDEMITQLQDRSCYLIALGWDAEGKAEVCLKEMKHCASEHVSS